MLDAFLKVAYEVETKARARPLEERLSALSAPELEGLLGEREKDAVAFASRFHGTPLAKEACALASEMLEKDAEDSVLSVKRTVLELRAKTADTAPEDSARSHPLALSKEAAEATARTPDRGDADRFDRAVRGGALGGCLGLVPEKTAGTKLALPLASLLRGATSGLGSLATSFVKRNPVAAAGALGGAALGGIRGAQNGGGVSGALTGAVGGGVVGGVAGGAAQGIGARLRAGQKLTHAVGNTAFSAAQKGIGALT